MAIYLKNADLLRELAASKAQGRPTDTLVSQFMLLATNTSRRLSYTNPMDREDCISSGIEDCLRYWKNFNPDRSDQAFGFFTQVIKNGMAKQWKKLHNPDMKTVSLTTLNFLEGGLNDE